MSFSAVSVPLNTREHIAFIVNSLFVRRTREEFENEISSYLDHQKYDEEFLYTQYPGHAAEHARSALNDGATVLVAAGGDGTVNEVGRYLIASDKTLGILPLGSGNGLARHLDIPKSAADAIGIINQGKTLLMDTGSVNEHPFISIAGIGFDARVANLYSKSQQHGFLAYLRITLSEYARYQTKIYNLNIDGQELEREAIMISFANSDQFGYETVIAPGAKVDDGLLDIVITRRFPLLETPIQLALLLNRQIDHSEYIEVFKARHVSIRRARGKRANIDGEAVRVGKTLDVTVHPASLRILVP
jgi:YegS/Rv2252/BmrU family lipid kinase